MEEIGTKNIKNYLITGKDNETKIIPYWLNLKQCCQLKGINYKTVNNKPHLKPDFNMAKKIGGRICWNRDYIFSNWILKTDEEIENE